MSSQIKSNFRLGQIKINKRVLGNSLNIICRVDTHFFNYYFLWKKL